MPLPLLLRRAGLLVGLIALCHAPLRAQTCLGTRTDTPGHRALTVSVGTYSPTAISPDHLALQASATLPRGVLGFATLEPTDTPRLGLGAAMQLVQLGPYVSLCPVAALYMDSGVGAALPLGVSLGATLPLGATGLEVLPFVTPQLWVLDLEPHLQAGLLLGYRSLVAGLSTGTRDASGSGPLYRVTLGWRSGL